MERTTEPCLDQNWGQILIYRSIAFQFGRGFCPSQSHVYPVSLKGDIWSLRTHNYGQTQYVFLLVLKYPDLAAEICSEILTNLWTYLTSVSFSHIIRTTWTLELINNAHSGACHWFFFCLHLMPPGSAAREQRSRNSHISQALQGVVMGSGGAWISLVWKWLHVRLSLKDLDLR